MGRETFSVSGMKGRLSRVWSSLPIAALLVCCEARKTPEQSAPKAPPFRSAPSERAPTREPSASFSLTDFRPLLTLPELASVVNALENGTPASAARELEGFFMRSPPAPEQRFRYEFLRARLHEQASEWAPALTAYERVGAGSSALANYARIGQARMLLALGRPSDVLAVLAPVPETEPVSRLAWPLRAEALRLVGDREQASIGYSRALTNMLPSAERADTELSLSNLLLPERMPNVPEADVLKALELSRRIQDDAAASHETLVSARALEVRALSILPEATRAEHAQRSAIERLTHAQALFDARHFAEAEQALSDALGDLSEPERVSSVSCQLRFLLGKVLSARRSYARAGEVFEELLNRAAPPNGSLCDDPDLRARAQFMAGKAATSDGQPMLAVKRFAALEREEPAHSLADDARYYGALAYLEAGVEARFTELLSSLPDDYPDGDMVVEGSFRLALRRFDKQDWQGAARVLERVLDNKFSTAARAADFAGRERYFYARALALTGETERAFREYERLVRDLPLSYYMLSAYSALSQADAPRARAALSSALASVSNGPVLISSRPEFSGPGFARALELFGVADLDNGARELDALGLGDSSRPELLWGLSKLYAEAGSVKLSHAAARRALSASPSSWPADAWVEAWKLAYPAPYHAIVDREAKRTLQDSALIYAIMREESAFDSDAESPADAYGLMQLIVPTAKAVARPLGLPFDPSALRRPSVNVALGASVLAQYAQQFPDDPLLSIAAYNAGPGNPRRWLREHPNADFDIWVELIPYPETRRYVKRVLSSRAAYAFLYQREDFEHFAILPAKP